MSKDTHFIDTEVEELPWTSWDDYDTYCENSERVFDAICDEAALYKIASEAVKKKLDSLNAYGKYYKEQYDKARDKIDELKQTIQNMEKTNTDLHKEIDNAKLEASKDCEEIIDWYKADSGYVDLPTENLYKTLDNAYYQRVRRAVAKGIRWKDALRLCKKPFGAKDYGD